MSDNFAVRLRLAREARNLSQEAFGALGGASRNSQFTYEAGKRAPDSDYLSRLAANGIDVGYLITGQRSGALLSEEDTALLDVLKSCRSDDRTAILHLAGRLST